MRAKSNSQENSPARIIPKAPWRVAEVRVLDDYKLHVRFMDHLEGEVDISQLVTSPTAGIFARLHDIKMFNQVYLEYGALTWPCGIDLPPDAMHEEIKKNGRWVLK